MGISYRAMNTPSFRGREAEPGIHGVKCRQTPWIPAFAGMTKKGRSQMVPELRPAP